MIEKESYPKVITNKINGASAFVRTQVSFIESDCSWAFFALKGTQYQSPKWFFLDSDDKIHTEYPSICEHLRANLSNKVSEVEWNQTVLKEYVQRLGHRERELLPNKRRRALEVADKLLDFQMKVSENLLVKSKLNVLKNLLVPKMEDEIVDFYVFAEQWIEILQPRLDKLRSINKNKKKVYNLYSLVPKKKKDREAFYLELDEIQRLIDNCPTTESIDTKMAACIIGVAKN